MISVSDAFETKLKAKTNNPRIRLVLGAERITLGDLDDDNGDFEGAGADGTDIETGTDWSKINCSAEVDDEAGSGVNTYNGSDFCCKIHSVTLGKGRIVLQGANLDAVWTIGQRYRIQFDYKVASTTKAVIRVSNDGATLDEEYSLTSTTWATAGFNFTVINNTDIVIEVSPYWAISGETGNEIVWIDNMSIKWVADDFLMGISQVSRKANLTSGFASIKLSNTEKTWNIFLSDKTNLGETAQLNFYFHGDTELLPLFTGTIEEAQYRKAEVTLKIRDKMLPMLEKRIGSGQGPVSYYAADHNPADLVWDILTVYGELDDTASTANTDIDYTSWEQWQTDCDTLSFVLRARFTGHYIKTALLKIAELTNTYIWVGGDGKFHFERPIPPFPPGGLTNFTCSNCLKIDTSLSKDTLCNKAKCYYGYSPDTDTWAGSYTSEDSSSQTEYGLREDVNEDKVIWHQTEGSAKSYTDRVIDKNKTPFELIDVTSTMLGYLQQLGDTITITELLKGYNFSPARIIEISSFNLENGTMDFKAREISDEQLAAFYLDDPVYGVLDWDGNPLY